MGIIYYFNEIIIYFVCRSEQYGWPTDPMWTESNWPTSTPNFEMFLKESSSVEYAALAAGLSVTVGSLVAATAVRLSWNKRMKRD